MTAMEQLLEEVSNELHKDGHLVSEFWVDHLGLSVWQTARIVSLMDRLADPKDPIASAGLLRLLDRGDALERQGWETHDESVKKDARKLIGDAECLLKEAVQQGYLRGLHDGRILGADPLTTDTAHGSRSA